GNATLVVDQEGPSGNGDIFSASTSGSPKFTITNAGGIKMGTIEGNINQCLVSGGTGSPASWGSCSAAANVWTLTNGAIYPSITSQDLLLGGVSSSSALFRVTGNDKFAGTKSVASVSANSSFAGLVVDNKGNGDLFTASSSGLPRFTIAQNGTVSTTGFGIVETNFTSHPRVQLQRANGTPNAPTIV